jgi:SWI/SNF-related matrix-associated actin-dependent regulator 1 of chromatin subfamily A
MIQLIFSSEDNKFVCLCNYNDRFVPKQAGFSWNVKLKQWETTDITIAEKLQKYANPFTTEALKQQKIAYNKKIEDSKKVSSNIVLYAPKGLNYLPFQKAGIEFCIKQKNVLLADEMGLGKTIQAIGIINNVSDIKKVLVVCTATLKRNWFEELKKWLIKPLKIKIVDVETDYNDEDILICSYNRLPKLTEFFKKDVFDLVVCDEVHLAKNKKALRTKAVDKISKRANRNVHMTGTPIVSRPAELFPIISRLGFEMDWYHYMQRYADMHQNKFGYMEYKGAKNLEELQQRLRASIMIRRMKADVLAELPDKIRQPVIFDAETKELKEAVKQEQKFLDKFDSYVEKINDLQFVADKDFSELASLRKNTAIAKIPLIIDFIQNTLENTDKVVVFAHHKELINQIYNEFKDEAVKLTGETIQEERHQAIQEFQNNPKIKIFIGSILACGAGITLTASSTVIFAELDWVSGNVSQAEDRCHRIGQKNTVMVYHLIVDGSIDVKISKMLIDKQRNIDKALNFKGA